MARQALTERNAGDIRLLPQPKANDSPPPKKSSVLFSGVSLGSYLYLGNGKKALLSIADILISADGSKTLMDNRPKGEETGNWRHAAAGKNIHLTKSRGKI